MNSLTNTSLTLLKSWTNSRSIRIIRPVLNTFGGLFISASGFAHLIPLLSKIKSKKSDPVVQTSTTINYPVNSTYQYHTDQLGNWQLWSILRISLKSKSESQCCVNSLWYTLLPIFCYSSVQPFSALVILLKATLLLFYSYIIYFLDWCDVDQQSFRNFK